MRGNLKTFRVLLACGFGIVTNVSLGGSNIWERMYTIGFGDEAVESVVVVRIFLSAISK